MRMQLGCLFVGVISTLSGVVEADDHIILKPSSGDAALPQKMLVMIPGGNVPNANYAETAKAIQKEASNLRLWVVIPAVFQRLCIISCNSKFTCGPLHKSVENALSLAAKQGWERKSNGDEEDIWLAGHSLGGVCATTLFQAYTSGANGHPYAGLILMGSYVDESGDYDLVNYPKPVFILNAELDGLTRPGKTAVWWRQHLELQSKKGVDAALSDKPVVILPKQNHSNFCPGFDVMTKPGDIMGEVSADQATATIGAAVAAFLHVQSATDADVKKKGLALLAEKAEWTKKLMAPYLSAQDMEHDASNVRVSSEGASSFCANAQKTIAGLSETDSMRVTVTDGYHASSPNLEHCHPNYTDGGGGKLLVDSCSHADYYLDISNLAFITAASEIACKMVSSDRLAEQLKTKAADPNVDCKKVNQDAVAMAESMALDTTLARFKKIGKGWCFLDDVPTLGDVGPVWVFKDALQLKETSTCMSVSSPVLKTQIDGNIYPGNHYCKFLSPARVLDWMMTDSLRKPKSEVEAVSESILI